MLFNLWAFFFEFPCVFLVGPPAQEVASPSGAAELPEVRLRLRHNEAQVRHNGVVGFASQLGSEW
jgi:hypothetical protein